jgi:type VI secretion system protein VasJ
VTYEQIRDRAKAWTASIPGASPAGAPAKFDPEYQAVANEVAKLDMPSGGAVNWKLVNEKAGAILAAKSKDLVIASCLAHGLHVTGGLAGLTSGCVLLVELMQQFWDTAFPDVKRLRGRANALQWFAEKTTAALAQPPGKVSPEEAEALEAAAVQLANLTREKLQDLAPAFGAILEVVGRVKEESAPPPPAPQAPPAPAQPEAPAGAPGAAPAAGGAPAEVAPPAEGEDLTAYLRATGAALIAAAHRLRTADRADPIAYRVLRTGVWLGVAGEPPAEGGRTFVPPPVARDALLEALQGQRWAELIEGAESAAGEDPLWLDPHRMTWQALGALGPAHEKARAAVVAEVRTFTGRLPGLASLAFSDGSPLADPATRAWLEEAAGASAPAGARPAAGGLDEAAAAALARAKELFGAGPSAEALHAAREVAAGGRSERERFLLRLEVARLYVASGLQPLALASFQELAREAQERGLDAWEPGLAAEALRGLVATARAVGDDPRGGPPDLATSYRRLCRLDPAAAYEVWP